VETISELVPDDAVVIVTVTGETGRIPMNEVEYAGPDKPTAEKPRTKPKVEEPSEEAPSPSQPDTPTTVRARFESVDVPIKFFASLEAGAGGEMQELCNAPCDKELVPGNYRFALAAPDSQSPLPALPTARLTEPATIRGKFRSRAGLRAAGGLTLFVGSIVGILLWATATTEEELCVNGTCTTVEVTNPEKLWAGRLITGGSIITGLVLITRGDDATVELVPGAPAGFSSPTRWAAARDLGSQASTALSGLSLVGRF
jgi:hypothetical protein